MQWSSWHNHTGDDPRFSYCADADMTPDWYHRQVRQAPWRAFALTDHAFALALPDAQQPWPHQWYHHPARLWEQREFRDEKTARYLERMAAVCDGERIFSGLEVEVACDGSLSMESRLWPHLHVVLGAIHYLPGAREDGYTAHLAQLDLLLNYPIDILAHPFRELSRSGRVPDEIIDETLRRAAEAGVAVEINAHMPFPQDPDVLARATRLGLRVAFGLDAHQRGELQNHRYFADVLRASGVRPGDLRLFSPARKTPNLCAVVR